MTGQQPGIKRTDLQPHDLSIPLRPPMTRDAAGTLLGQTMGLVAVTAAPRLCALALGPPWSMSIPMTMRRPPRSRPLGSSKSRASWSGSSSQPDYRSSPSPPPGIEGLPQNA